MKADEVISKASLFAMNFIAKISDTTEQPARKQAFFLDNQEELQKYMGALQKIITGLSDIDNIDDDDKSLIDSAQNVINDLKKAISEYQKELTISDDTSEEDTTAALTQETIADAMKTNKTTQEISANMQAIAEQQKVNQIGYNYALVCDGQINMIAAENKVQLIDSINALANTGNYKDIQLYKMTFTPVPLKQQTILTI
jgi:sugar-specific transcriptional regulator TrmB